MSTLVLERDPAAVGVTIADEKLKIDLDDGRRLVVPLAWYPRLLYAFPTERQHWQLLGDGYAIEWPDLDEHIGIEGLLAGRRSGESKKSFERWLASRQRLGHALGELSPGGLSVRMSGDTHSPDQALHPPGYTGG